MDQPERAVAVARPLVTAALDDHAHRGQVVDLVELAALAGHLVVDRVEVLRAARDLGWDVDLVELVLEHERGLANVLLAVGTPLGDHLLDLLVLARVQRPEREILELPLESVDAEPVGKRRVDLERLTRLAHLGLFPHVLDRPQVVEPVGELDQDHAKVLGHRDDQLAVVLCLRLLTTLELDAGQLGHALDELRDLVTERGGDISDLDPGVLHGVMQKRGGNRLLVHPQAREDLRGPPWVIDELLAGAPQLAVVRCGREPERPRDQLAVEVRLVRLKLGKQFVDKVLMLFRYRHTSILPGSGPDPFQRSRDVLDRKPRVGAETGQSMFRRRRSARRLRLAARLLLTLNRS